MSDSPLSPPGLWREDGDVLAGLRELVGETDPFLPHSNGWFNEIAGNGNAYTGTIQAGNNIGVFETGVDVGETAPPTFAIDNYGHWLVREYETEGQEAAIPEPTTFLLLGIGIVGLAGAEVRRRRKKKEVDRC